ncbi:hypothetical protein [Mesorhizobium sp. M0500]|uniref:hypothetical protein n=1 Tax=Mesorhizobium sp. M0500 TaxID=2956953 RepID=UPI003339A64B
MNDLTLPLSGLSSVGGKSVVARFDGGMLSSNSGVLALARTPSKSSFKPSAPEIRDD